MSREWHEGGTAGVRSSNTWRIQRFCDDIRHVIAVPRVTAGREVCQRVGRERGELAVVQSTPVARERGECLRGVVCMWPHGRPVLLLAHKHEAALGLRCGNRGVS